MNTTTRKQDSLDPRMEICRYLPELQAKTCDKIRELTDELMHTRGARGVKIVSHRRNQSRGGGNAFMNGSRPVM
jgi:hypothetical protein